jgi:hypothetical protein
MSGHDAQLAAHVQRLLDGQAAQLAAFQATSAAEIARLRESWSSGAEYVAGHEARMQQIRDDHQARMARIVNGETEEPATTDVAQGQVGASTAGRNAPASSVPGPGQPNHAAEEFTADDIKALDMQDFGALRQRMGMGNASGLGLFG